MVNKKFFVFLLPLCLVGEVSGTDGISVRREKEFNRERKLSNEMAKRNTEQVRKIEESGVNATFLKWQLKKNRLERENLRLNGVSVGEKDYNCAKLRGRSLREKDSRLLAGAVVKMNVNGNIDPNIVNTGSFVPIVEPPLFDIGSVSGTSKKHKADIKRENSYGLDVDYLKLLAGVPIEEDFGSNRNVLVSRSNMISSFSSDSIDSDVNSNEEELIKENLEILNREREDSDERWKDNSNILRTFERAGEDTVDIKRKLVENRKSRETSRKDGFKHFKRRGEERVDGRIAILRLNRQSFMRDRQRLVEDSALRKSVKKYKVKRRIANSINNDNVDPNIVNTAPFVPIVEPAEDLYDSDENYFRNKDGVGDNEVISPVESHLKALELESDDSNKVFKQNVEVIGIIESISPDRREESYASFINSDIAILKRDVYENSARRKASRMKERNFIKDKEMSKLKPRLDSRSEKRLCERKMDSDLILLGLQQAEEQVFVNSNTGVKNDVVSNFNNDDVDSKECEEHFEQGGMKSERLNILFRGAKNERFFVYEKGAGALEKYEKAFDCERELSDEMAMEGERLLDEGEACGLDVFSKRDLMKVGRRLRDRDRCEDLNSLKLREPTSAEVSALDRNIKTRQKARTFFYDGVKKENKIVDVVDTVRANLDQEREDSEQRWNINKVELEAFDTMEQGDSITELEGKLVRNRGDREKLRVKELNCFRRDLAEGKGIKVAGMNSKKRRDKRDYQIVMEDKKFQELRMKYRLRGGVFSNVVSSGQIVPIVSPVYSGDDEIYSDDDYFGDEDGVNNLQGVETSNLIESNVDGGYFDWFGLMFDWTFGGKKKL